MGRRIAGGCGRATRLRFGMLGESGYRSDDLCENRMMATLHPSRLDPSSAAKPGPAPPSRARVAAAYAPSGYGAPECPAPSVLVRAGSPPRARSGPASKPSGRNDKHTLNCPGPWRRARLVVATCQSTCPGLRKRDATSDGRMDMNGARAAEESADNDDGSQTRRNQPRRRARGGCQGAL